MAFWGVEVKPGRSFTLSVSDAGKRLHISQATLGVGNARNKSIVRCNFGNQSPVFLCALFPDKVESSRLNLEFEEAAEVIFSVIGPRSVHLTGYYLNSKVAFTGNDDEPEIYAEDIADTETERSTAENDYDYSDSFINDEDPSTYRDSPVPDSDDDDELTIKEITEKLKNKRINGKSRRLRKKYQVSDSDSDENWKLGAFSVVGDSSTGSSVELQDSESEYEVGNLPASKNALSPRQTRSRARGMVNGKTDCKMKKTFGAEAHRIHEVLGRRWDTPSGDLLQSSNQEYQKSPLRRKRRNETQNCSVELKYGVDKNIEKEADKSTYQAQISKKTTKKCRKVQDEGNIFKSESGKEGTDNEHSDSAYKPRELETSSTVLIIQELEKGNWDGKSAVRGKKVSIAYTGKLKESGRVFDSNIGKAPLRFRLGGDKVIEGLNIGVEGMRVGDKRRLIIPPSLGCTKARPTGNVPENAWLVYEVEAVKVR